MSVCLGTRIKELRQIHNMSQEDLGKRIGLQRAAIQKYEKGTVENIPLKTIEKIAMIFEVSPCYLVGWEITDGNALSSEIKIIQGVQHFYGKESVSLLESFTKLNSKGKQRVHQYIDDISMVYSDERINL